MNVTRESSKKTSWGVTTDLAKVIKGALDQDGIDILLGCATINPSRGYGQWNELYEKTRGTFSPYGRKVLWVSYEPTEPTSDSMPILRVKVTVQEDALMENAGRRKKIDSILAIINKAVETELNLPTYDNIERVHPKKVKIEFAGFHVLI